MSSNASVARQGEPASAAVAAQLARAIEECAAAARRSGGAAESDLCARLATMWAMLTDTDPELAAAAARYAGLGDRRQPAGKLTAGSRQTR